ncbi:MAG TPA: tetratricopeptide repeat protein, partial [Opitutus sp.]|nr:tetratricopeptide repeat protein [Opitutus sp.]
LRSQLSGDLDWIVMKALEKNRMRRYESASAFAADLQRHLHNEPVTARPPSAAYLIQKLIHRHKVGFAAAAAIAVALVLGLAFSTWSFLRERAARERAVAAERQQVELRRQAETARNEEAAQRRQAEQARERAVAAEAEQAKQRAAAEAARNEEAAQRALAEEARNKEAAQRALAEAATANEARQRALAEAEEKKAVSAAAKSDQAFRFMAKMLSGVSPSVAAGRDTTLLREILDKTVKRLARLDDEPEIQVNLSTIIGLTYLDLGDTAKAGAIAGEALAKAEKLFGHDHLVTAGALTLLCGVRSQQGKYEEGEAAGLDALAILRRLPEPHDEEIGETESMLGLNQLAQGKLVAAEATFRDAIAIAGRIGDDDELPRDSLELLLASVLQKQGRLAEAGTMVSAALPTLKERLGAGHPTMAMAYLIRSNVLLAQGKYDEALTLYDEALPLLKKSLSPKHPAVITLLTNKAIIVERQGKLAEAEALDREILAAQTESLGGDHPSTINTMSFLSSVLRKEGKTADAARVDREIDASLRRTLKSPDVVDASKQASQGLSALIEGDPAKAEARLRASLAVLEKSFGADNPVLLSAQLLLAGSILFQGRAAEAEVLTRKLLDTCRLTVGEKSVFTLNAEVQLAQTLIPQGKLAEAGDLLQKSLELGKSLGTESASAPGTLVLLALVRALENQPAESAALLQRSAGLTTGLPANVQGLVSFACLVLNDAFDHNQHFAEAVILHRTIVAFESQVHGRNSTEMAKALGGLASALVRAQQFAEAETVARDALALRQKRLTPGDWLIYNAQKLVGDSLVGQKRYAEAEPLLLGAFKEMQSRPPKASEAGLRATWRQRLSEAAAALAGLYETTSQPDKAAAWQKQRDELATPEPSSA